MDNIRILHWAFAGVDGEHRGDAARVAVQTVAAAAAVYFVMRWAGLPEMSWAVISALFVIHVNFDSTLTAATGRLAATLLGSGLALALVELAGGPELTLLRLVIAAGVMSAVGAIWPSLRYGAVPAAVIALDQKSGLTGGALALTVAVFVGTGIGAASSILVWPDFGRRRALRHLTAALKACRDLVEASMAELLDDRGRQLSAIHNRFLRNVEKANAIAAQTWLGSRLGGASLGDLGHAVQRLWHSLVIVDRIIHDPAMRIAPDDFKAIEPQTRKVQRSASRYLDSIISQLSAGERRADHDKLQRNLSEALAISDRLIGGASRDRQDLRAVQALLFAVHEMAKNLAEIDSLCAGTEKRAQVAPWWRRALQPLAPSS